MGFDVYGANQNEGKKSVNTVDFDELNKYVVETAGLQNREVLVGYVSCIVDLGTQEQPDSENVFTGTPEEEKETIAKFPATYFKDGKDAQTGKPVRLKCWPNKPIQSVAVAVDFPDVIIDKGKFFGESKPLPLRLWLGGQFYTEGMGMVIGRPTPLKVNKSIGTWSFDKKHLFHKMAVASKLIQPDQAFLPKDIDQLLGKAFQFEAQVFFKEGKNDKKYYTEYVKFVSGLGRGQQSPEPLTKPLMIQFNKINEEQDVRDLRAHVVNTIKRAENYQGSMIQKQIDAIRGNSNKESEAPAFKEDAPAQKSSKKAEKQAADFDSFDSDIPF